MSDLLSMGVVVGGAVSSSYYKSLGSAEAQAKKLGERWEKTNKRASAVGDLVRCRAALDTLRCKQGVPALAPTPHASDCRVRARRRRAPLLLGRELSAGEALWKGEVSKVTGGLRLG